SQPTRLRQPIFNKSPKVSDGPGVRPHHFEPGLRPPRDSMKKTTTYRTVARQPGQRSRSAPTANHKLNSQDRFFKG
ncbi:MAG: hypothetical protein ACKVHE_35290, partial [Planctomycetales bacterium]